MAALPEGVPIWADAVLPDLEAGKSFYGELLGWEFAEGNAQYGHYTQAFSGGKNVAALFPRQDENMPAAWTLYFASPDIQATATKIRDNGGEILMGPMAVGEFGSMLVAKDPGGASFGAWQPGTHKGFEKQGEPGSFCWAEVGTRDTDAVDSFYPAVFGYSAKQIGDGSDFDFKVWELGDKTVAGRYKMGPEMPAEVPPHVMIYFAVPNCDDAVATATKLGGAVRRQPQDSPFGRFAVLADQQGAVFSVIDLSTTVGEKPA